MQRSSRPAATPTTTVVSGPLTFAGNGEPIVASYGMLVMGDNNRIDISKTEYITAEGPPELDVPQVPVEGSREGDGVLKFGALLPQTGSLAFLGPPEFAGFNLAHPGDQRARWRARPGRRGHRG